MLNKHTNIPTLPKRSHSQTNTGAWSASTTRSLGRTLAYGRETSA